MTVKYRVHEVAKDFEKSSEEILNILNTYTEGEKKKMSALEESDLDVIFDKLTQDNSVKSYKAYFEEGAKKKA